jgi:hypothetical protein
MAWDIVLLEQVDIWFLKLCETDPATAALVEQAIDRLADEGPGLGRPLVDTLEHSKLRNLKELRPGSARQIGDQDPVCLRPWPPGHPPGSRRQSRPLVALV